VRSSGRDRTRRGLHRRHQPCVAFNNHAGSTRATTTCASTMKRSTPGFLPSREAISVEYNEATRSPSAVRRLGAAPVQRSEYDRPTRQGARVRRPSRGKSEVVTGALPRSQPEDLTPTQYVETPSTSFREGALSGAAAVPKDSNPVPRKQRYAQARYLSNIPAPTKLLLRELVERVSRY